MYSYDVDPIVSKDVLLATLDTLDDDLYKKAQQLKKKVEFNNLHYIFLPLAILSTPILSTAEVTQFFNYGWINSLLLIIAVFYIVCFPLGVFTFSKTKSVFLASNKKALTKYYLSRYKSKNDFVKSFFTQEMLRNNLYEKRDLNPFEGSVARLIKNKAHKLNNELDEFYNNGKLTPEVKKVLYDSLHRICARCEDKVSENALKMKLENIKIFEKMLGETTKQDLLKYWKD